MSVRRADARLALLAAVIAILIAFAWRSTPGVVARALLDNGTTEVPTSGTIVRVTIPTGANAAQIVEALDAAGAIADAEALRVLLRLTGQADVRVYAAL